MLAYLCGFVCVCVQPCKYETNGGVYLIFHQVGKFFKAFYCIILNFLIFFQEYKIIIAVDAELLDFFIKLDNFFIGWIAKQVVDQSEYHVARVDAVFYLINAFYLLSELLFQVFELLDA